MNNDCQKIVYQKYRFQYYHMQFHCAVTQNRHFAYCASTQSVFGLKNKINENLVLEEKKYLRQIKGRAKILKFFP
jgi:hypothetical protein